MKRLSGGAVLLNLTDISLGITSGEVSITDAGVLGELTELRNFIDTQRDFSKGFKSLKPVLVEYRSSASKFNGIALANLSFNTDALHMSIGVNTIQADGKMLIIAINVVYAWSDYIGYTISSAKLNAYETLATGDGTFTGDVGVGGDLAVTGDASVGGDLEVTGDANFKDDIKINGESALKTFNGNISANVVSLGLTNVASFIKVVRNFNELQFIFNCRLTNETEETITITNDTSIANFNVDDNNIQNKIYAHSGDACAYNSDISRGSIAMATLFLSQTTGLALEHRNVNLFHTNGNFNFYLEGGSITINAGATIDCEARISLAL